MRLQWRTANRRITMQIMAKQALRMSLQTKMKRQNLRAMPVKVCITIIVPLRFQREPLIWHIA